MSTNLVIRQLARFSFAEKQCPDLLSTFGSNIVVSNQTSMLYHYGDNVTMECKEGYAFDVDLNEPVDRVTTQKVFFCEDDINSSSAKWSSGEECQSLYMRRCIQINFLCNKQVDFYMHICIK